MTAVGVPTILGWKDSAEDLKIPTGIDDATGTW